MCWKYQKESHSYCYAVPGMLYTHPVAYVMPIAARRTTGAIWCIWAIFNTQHTLLVQDTIVPVLTAGVFGKLPVLALDWHVLYVVHVVASCLHRNEPKYHDGNCRRQQQHDQQLLVLHMTLATTAAVATICPNTGSITYRKQEWTSYYVHMTAGSATYVLPLYTGASCGARQHQQQNRQCKTQDRTPKPVWSTGVKYSYNAAVFPLTFCLLIGGSSSNTRKSNSHAPLPGIMPGTEYALPNCHVCNDNDSWYRLY